MNQIVVVVGYQGEVGSAIWQLYREKMPSQSIIGYDLKGCSGLNSMSNAPKVSWMHICIPYSDDGSDFFNAAKGYFRAMAPEKIIVHSTVPVGTCRRLSKILGVPVTHSPVRGVHPGLYRGILQYVKFFGGGDAEDAADHFKKMGIRTYVAKSSDATELAKLQETSYYGVLVAWTYEMYLQSKQFGVDWKDIEHYTRTTNDYTPRPVLYPPKDGIIGGHCVVPNAKLLQKQLYRPSAFLNRIIYLGRKR